MFALKSPGWAVELYGKGHLRVYAWAEARVQACSGIRSAKVVKAAGSDDERRDPGVGCDDRKKQVPLPRPRRDGNNVVLRHR